MDIELSGNQVLLSLSILTLCIVLLIVGLRKFFKSKKIKPLRFTGTNFRLGMLSALAFVLLSFSWTTYDDYVYFEIDDIIDEVISIDIPPTIQKPPPPPPPPIIEDVPEELIEEDELEDFVDQSVEEDTEVIDVPIELPEKVAPPAPPPPPNVEPELNEIIGFAEQMPRFPGCEDLEGTKKEKDNCSEKKLLSYIYDNLKYPRMALETGIEGTVTVQFVINKNGEVSDVNVVRGIGGGCDAAAAKIVEGMNKLNQRWTPGKQRGRNVNVRYTLPIKFKQLN